MPIARRLPISVALLAALLGSTFAGAAQGASLTGAAEPASQGGPWPADITFGAARGEHNLLTTSASGGDTATHPSVVTFHDAGAVIHARGLCANVSPHTARCRAPSFASASIHLGDEDDVARLGVAAYVYAGDGDDLVDASHGDYVNVVGGYGDDHLIGSPAQDDLNGGPGDDLVEGRGGSDTITGGPGSDAIACGAGSDDFAVLDRSDRLIDEVFPPRSLRAFTVGTSCETLAQRTPTDTVQLRAVPVRLAPGALVVQAGTLEGAAGSITATDATGTVLATGTIPADGADVGARRLALTDAGRAQLAPGTTSVLLLRLEAGLRPVAPITGPGILVIVHVPAAT
ncbi:MAG: hypothetical protein REI11_22125 [Patulibacter sp.]|nr:hypothetical protein [Patulibacter sp.]